MLEAQLSGSVKYKLINKEMVIDRALGNMIAASDATRALLCGVVLTVAMSQRVQAKLIDEQQQVMLPMVEMDSN